MPTTTLSKLPATTLLQGDSSFELDIIGNRKRKLKLFILSTPFDISKLHIVTFLKALDRDTSDFFHVLLNALRTDLISRTPPRMAVYKNIRTLYEECPEFHESITLLELMNEVGSFLSYLEDQLKEFGVYELDGPWFNCMWIEYPDTVCFFKTEVNDIA